MGRFSKEVVDFITNRVVIVFFVISCMMFFLVLLLFNLQVVQGEDYLNSFEEKIQRDIEVLAPRGTIYDKNGIPLAINETVYSVKIDPSANVYDINDMLFNLITLFEENDQEYDEDFPITLNKPYEFTFHEETRKNLWLVDMGFMDATGRAMDVTATEVMEKLASDSYFSIDDNYSEVMKRKVIGLRSAIYLKRFSRYVAITLALDVKPEIVTAIEEDGEKYASVYIDLDSKRIYPYGKYVSHMLGYIGTISREELEELNANGENSYSLNDKVGKFGGIEENMENYLKGEKGLMSVEVNSLGKRVSIQEITPPTPGDKIYLTIDINLQIETYEILKKQLRDILISKLEGRVAGERISSKDAIISMIEANNVPVQEVWKQPEGTKSYEIKGKIEAIEDVKVDTVENRKVVKDILIEEIEENRIKENEILLVMYEIGILTFDEKTLERLNNNRVNNTAMLVEKLRADEITPQMLNMQPSTGSIVVVDVNSGDVLAAVAYPSYDNNEFVNGFNDEYFYKVIRDDPTEPLANRPFMEAKAPGSTFKMLTAIAGLENGTITASSTVYDRVTFKDAGAPYLNCWSSVSHGNVNVIHALEVSCNYFFCDVSYNFGNAKTGTTRDGINIMNKYMSEFGLGERTGVEITEMADLAPKDIPIYASPEYKYNRQTLWNPNVPKSETEWNDGDTIQTSIGQSVNNYTAATMAKYVMTLANGGNRYRLRLVGQIDDTKGNVVEKSEPFVEQKIEFSEGTLDTIYEGMYRVTTGRNGTATNIFRNFPIVVAGKTGTAQEVISSTTKAHSSFAGFAPFDNPEIAVYAMIPNGDTKTYSAPATRVSASVIKSYYGFDDNEVPISKTEDNSFIN